jgi:hypothetical protein
VEIEQAACAVDDPFSYGTTMTGWIRHGVRFLSYPVSYPIAKILC